MDASRYEQRFEELIASTGVPLDSLTPAAGLEVILSFYREHPYGLLSCFWGTVTRYGDEEVGFSFNHFLNVESADGTIEVGPHLSLLFRFGSEAEVGEFPFSMIGWCSSVGEIESHRSKLQSEPAFRVLGHTPALQVAFVFEDGASSAHALYDCWGARDPSRPVVHMTEEEWLQSDNVVRMLRWFRQEWRGEEAVLNQLVQRYLLACCRKIWKLLPMEASRDGVEVAERYVEGRASREEFWRAEWHAEGAALGVDSDTDPESRARSCNAISEISPGELATLIHSPRPDDDLSPRGLLLHAAYFVEAAMTYPRLNPKESIERYTLFMPAPLLRQVVGNPFRS